MHLYSTLIWLIQPLLAILLVSSSDAQPALLSVHGHVRSSEPLTRSIIAAGYAASPSFRRLVATIEASDVIVYVERRTMCSKQLVGMTRFAAAAPGARYVRVTIDRELLRAYAAAVLAHELQHVVEIASAPWVVDRSGVQRLFEAIGYTSGHGGKRYDTDGAVAAGRRALSELLAVSRRSVGRRDEVAASADSSTHR